jgi:hypothetical protein
MSYKLAKVYEMINYIHDYINDNAIANIKRFNYFEYDNLVNVISNAIPHSTFKKNIISINDYEIIIDTEINHNYEITIIKNIDLYEPTGPK